ncbi:MAG TPA: LysR family transcriptional regulator [Steroidobacteraceae bacterium]|nr:LysR family transcriptional regulator [Steroidobacteraceae bacterium]
MPHAVIRFRVDVGAELGIGPGKIALLEHIGESGSLSQAARALGMSYRRAWQLLNSLNACLQEPVTRAKKGGEHGGGSSLTAFGRELIRVYRRFEADTQRRGARAFRAVGARVRHTRRPRGAVAGAAGRPLSER